MSNGQDLHHDEDRAATSPLHTAIRQHLSRPGATNLGFLQVLAELCEVTGWVPPDVSALGPFDPVSFEAAVAGVGMCLSCVPGGGGGVYLACLFGQLPERAALQAATRLLELNLFLHTHGRSAFCIDSQSGDVVCGCRFDEGSLSAASLFDGMRLMSEQALRWREGWFLDPAPACDPLARSVYA
ncbi:MAG: hypothetical protein GTN84_17815 [Hydrogenophaga sp.]|uniref:CesT family type III secretion system chaperone n=1 Tax=Hydrogenophaga sp. TaxID=1904254 RepID=UPI0016A4071D|nr:CesT family type III secretion system chaperone [Hydrogenophaga sp.]NIM43101.1 hypothetical protein [Hydrogenophaga sp.]NIN28169.1 hypothetical protein [Hydrogenophaga sp.]NIN30607.1 hypothetical protein [Hydrogenophaga sp.]NIN57304.1 hypothetical protein [Hydrogenophaga sp.]NIO51523.1 hypothetical protein [Hydrogenophaga sp.]